jgi:4-amino-4-deoxy-L-arabinose transferase-like glycosyltransferase
MSAALIAALFFTVSLLVTHAYFLLGSAPLLVLKHDIPMDARFVRGFFDTYYLAAMCTASATAASFALAGRPAFAAGAAALALLAAGLRRKVIPRMDSLRQRIQASDPGAVTAFRRLHVAAILLNLAQLAVIVWGLIAFSLQLGTQS